MTDETWQQLREHLDRYAVPPLHPGWPQSALPLTLHVDQTVPPNKPVLELDRVTVHPEDYTDIKRHLAQEGD